MHPPTLLLLLVMETASTAAATKLEANVPTAAAHVSEDILKDVEGVALHAAGAWSVRVRVRVRVHTVHAWRKLMEGRQGTDWWRRH